MISLSVCHVCGGKLAELRGFPVAIQVTSDCRPWKGVGRLAACGDCGTVQKIVSKEWLEDISNLYAQYSMYEQGGGCEQVSFDSSSGAGTARSKKIVDWLRAISNLPQEGTLLDVGCGNGAFMRAFGDQYPGWRMTGLELDARNQTSILAIPGVVEFLVGDVESVQARFDLIVLVHALEHVPNPVRFLQKLCVLLNPGGVVLIEVPDVAKSPFDILIADHCSHFSAHTLRGVVGVAGLDVDFIDAGCVPKELTLLARQTAPANGAVAAASKEDGAVVAREHIAWLESVLVQGQSSQAPVGIFGTSISATWLAAALGKKVTFFVDEDANRIGRKHMGLPIHGPRDAPRTLPVLMPLKADIAASICARLSHTSLHLVRPPAG